MRELLVVIATVAMLALLQASALDATQGKSRLALCRAHFEQLSDAWTMYAADSNGALVYNADGANAGKTYDSPSWAGGWLDFTSNNTDNTNLNLLTKYLAASSQRTSGPYYGGLLGPYFKNASVFRCPEDQSKCLEGAIRFDRVRSVSMNAYMHGVHANKYTGQETLGTWAQPPFRLFRRLSDISGIRPSTAFTFMDERSDSINDPAWNMNLGLALDANNALTPDTFKIVDYPASWHDRGGLLSFADGHVEHWKWQDPRTTLPLQEGKPLNSMVDSPGNVDIGRISRAASFR